MMTILVDEGYAFDFLSILEVKSEEIKTQKNSQSMNECLKHISEQISERDLKDMMGSAEYKNMVKANKKTFLAVDKARYGSVSAKYVDECNMERYKAKVAFQGKFFPTTSISEVKT